MAEPTKFCDVLGRVAFNTQDWIDEQEEERHTFLSAMGVGLNARGEISVESTAHGVEPSDGHGDPVKAALDRRAHE